MSVYRRKTTTPLSEITTEQRVSNQIVFTGTTSDAFLVPKGVVLLELLQVETGNTVAIEDGEGNVLATGVTDFEQEHSPLLCDKGIKIIGAVTIAKASVIDGIYL